MNKGSKHTLLFFINLIYIGLAGHNSETGAFAEQFLSQQRIKIALGNKMERCIRLQGTTKQHLFHLDIVC
jgi:hypothetical protein